MRVTRLVLGPLETNCWIVSDDRGGPAIVIDPAEDSARILTELGDRSVAAVVLTHGHFDHLGAVKALLAESGAPLLVHAEDAESITTPTGSGGAAWGFDVSSPPADRLLHDGDVVDAGDLRLSVLHTPGHTPGGICLFGRWRREPAPSALLGRHAVRGQRRTHGLPGRRRPRAVTLDRQHARPARPGNRGASRSRTGHDDRPRTTAEPVLSEGVSHPSPTLGERAECDGRHTWFRPTERPHHRLVQSRRFAGRAC